jgi:hypothetical protein
MAEVREARVYRLSLQEAVELLTDGLKERGVGVPPYDWARLDLDTPNNVIQLTIVAVPPGAVVTSTPAIKLN